LYLFKHHNIKIYGEMESHSFLNFALNGKCKLHAPVALPLGKESPVPTGQDADEPPNWSYCGKKFF
jgi:hypothetical protein